MWLRNFLNKKVKFSLKNFTIMRKFITNSQPSLHLFLMSSPLDYFCGAKKRNICSINDLWKVWKGSYESLMNSTVSHFPFLPSDAIYPSPFFSLTPLYSLCCCSSWHFSSDRERENVNAWWIRLAFSFWCVYVWNIFGWWEKKSH